MRGQVRSHTKYLTSIAERQKPVLLASIFSLWEHFKTAYSCWLGFLTSSRWAQREDESGSLQTTLHCKPFPQIHCSPELFWTAPMWEKSRKLSEKLKASVRAPAVTSVWGHVRRWNTGQSRSKHANIMLFSVYYAWKKMTRHLCRVIGWYQTKTQYRFLHLTMRQRSIRTKSDWMQCLEESTSVRRSGPEEKTWNEQWCSQK